MNKEKILGKLDGDSEEDIEKDMLSKFGFGYICGIGSRYDGSVIIDIFLSEEEGKECELWVDYKNERALVYSFGSYPHFIDGNFTKDEEKQYFT